MDKMIICTCCLIISQFYCCVCHLKTTKVFLPCQSFSFSYTQSLYLFYISYTQLYRDIWVIADTKTLQWGVDCVCVWGVGRRDWCKIPRSQHSAHSLFHFIPCVIHTHKLQSSHVIFHKGAAESLWSYWGICSISTCEGVRHVLLHSSEGVDFKKEKPHFWLFSCLLPCLCVSRTLTFNSEMVQNATGFENRWKEREKAMLVYGWGQCLRLSGDSKVSGCI